MLMSMQAGVSGLRNQQMKIDVLGNNIANVNTIGFKGGRINFAESLNQTLQNASNGNPMQVGLGMKVSSIDNLFSQGGIEQTGVTTDLAIEGEGFFLLKEPGDDTTYYSRAGAFRFDEDGYLVNPEGYRVQGKLFDTNGDLVAGD